MADLSTPFWIEGIATGVLVIAGGVGGMFSLGKMDQRTHHLEDEMEKRVTKVEFEQVMDNLREIKADIREIRDYARNGKRADD